MSVSFDASGTATEIADTATGLAIDATDVTIAIRHNPASTQTDVVARLFVLNSGSTLNSMSLYYASGSASHRIQLRDGSGNDTSQISGSMTANTWNSTVFRMDSATTFSTWLNGSQVHSARAAANSVDMTGITHDDVVVGGSETGAQDFNGLLADAAVWLGRLSDADAMAYTHGASPRLLRSAPLIIHWLGLADIYREEFEAVTLANVGISPSLDASDNPRMIFPE